MTNENKKDMRQNNCKIHPNSVDAIVQRQDGGMDEIHCQDCLQKETWEKGEKKDKFEEAEAYAENSPILHYKGSDISAILPTPIEQLPIFFNGKYGEILRLERKARKEHCCEAAALIYERINDKLMDVVEIQQKALEEINRDHYDHVMAPVIAMNTLEKIKQLLEG